MKSNTIKTLGLLGLLASIIVGVGEYFLHYSPQILEHSEHYAFFDFVSIEHLQIGHFLSVIGLPFYFAGYLHIYKMLQPGNENLARITLAIGFIAFAVGGIWIGSRAFIGTIVQLQKDIPPDTYQQILNNYTELLEILVKALRVIIALLSITFVTTILKGGTNYKKWMAFFNPITILIVWVILGRLLPFFGKHTLPILMNVTHFILFSLSLYQYQIFQKTNTK
ncbi:MAG: hypothetical protein COW66_02400 [Flavobacteriaceae bacterium CG18_big_fil_WC_8_21_14_2_50_34_36]|nr:MAG: hypothetical protein COW66_02400 [Flavobacteriaceae bacterium CG18_big_fil_WC_8_21_14_2_50_34_36]PIV50854.1 MAG: hypothetical protein COS19_03250 [Flavobacteriaceae bacterium CG02_land_8_20_14_3_00_34_13]